MNKNIPVIIFCGGLGSRMREETEFKPKPLVTVGEKPILWHIMKIYSHYNYNNFVLALGYKGYMIKEYFLNLKVFTDDLNVNIVNNKIDYLTNDGDSFQIKFIETGLESPTGERLLKVKKYITEDEFMVTYGDGVADIDINKLIVFHRKQGTIGTITGVHPYSKFGLVKIDDKSNLVLNFTQKPLLYDYISGGFMIFNKKAFDYFDNGPVEDGLVKLANEKQLSVFKHEGFWKAMDTYNEMEELNKLWQQSKPWAVWEKNNVA